MVIAGSVAGGSGLRMGGDLPKQLMKLNGKPVFIHTVERFLASSLIDVVIIGINPQWHKDTVQLLQQYLGNRTDILTTDGGADRNGTVLRIIEAAEKTFPITDEDILLTHDAVRPFVTEKMIADSIQAMSVCDICTAAVPVVDTVLSTENGMTAAAFLDREMLRLVQTPQTFRIKTFRKVYHSLDENERITATDVCGLYCSKGYSVYLIEGSSFNIKLTYPSDFRTAEGILASQ